MSEVDFDSAHAAMQRLKDHPDVLRRFQEALGGISAATGLAYDDPTLTYVANALSNQRLITSNSSIARIPGTEAHGGFLIKASIKA